MFKAWSTVAVSANLMPFVEMQASMFTFFFSFSLLFYYSVSDSGSDSGSGSGSLQLTSIDINWTLSQTVSSPAHIKRNLVIISPVPSDRFSFSILSYHEYDSASYCQTVPFFQRSIIFFRFFLLLRLPFTASRPSLCLFSMVLSEQFMLDTYAARTSCGTTSFFHFTHAKCAFGLEYDSHVHSIP